MCSPLSGILAEVFLNNIENTKMWSDNNKLKDKIVFYCRYVDDTLLLFHGNSRQLSLLNNQFNKFHRNLKFTMEQEADNSINFLDLTISKINNKLAFKIYRKPTTTSQTIHESSHHPHTQKIAAYHSLVNRLVSIPMTPEDFEEERNVIINTLRCPMGIWPLWWTNNK